MYNDFKNIQVLISLLKKHGVRKVIASPGAMNIGFMGSIQKDDYFEIYSCVDERSAGYMACGLAQESGEPVILSCTGATASRNYAPALTEAFYNKIPILAITAAQHPGRIGQNIPQVLDRTVQFNDLVNKSVQILPIETEEDQRSCINLINDALLELRHNGGGPVHINLVTSLEVGFNTKELPDINAVSRYTQDDVLPQIKEEKTAIFIGNHIKINRELEKEIEDFCEKYNGVVLCDSTSNYTGNYKIMGNLICDQDKYSPSCKKIDLLIHIGNISGSYMIFNPKRVYRVNPDGIYRNTFYNLDSIFQMNELTFFKHYNEQKKDRRTTSYYEEWQAELDDLRSRINLETIPFSNIWIAQVLSQKIQKDANLHLGILNSLRSWNYCINTNNPNFSCNTGGFGIDGPMSTTIGMSICNRNKINYCILGDLAFFYDLNLRILLINNGCGTEFHNYNHYAHNVDSSLIGEYIAADGHNGNRSKTLIKNLSVNLGFEYLSAENKAQFMENVGQFTTDKTSKPIIFEVFTDSDKESEALKYMRNLKKSTSDIAKNNIKNTAKKILPLSIIKRIKK